jgi:hypothetical protein
VSSVDLPDPGNAPELGLFAGKQAFFFRFLFSAESHRFSEMLARSLAAKIDELCSPSTSTSTVATPRAAQPQPQETAKQQEPEKQKEKQKQNEQLGADAQIDFDHKIVVTDFPERLIKSTVCAKFLGWLRFTSVQQSTASVGSAAGRRGASGLEFVAARNDHENIAQRSAAVPGYFDVLQYVLRASYQGSLCLTMPWVLEYLRMMAFDLPSYRTHYVQGELLPTLRSLSRQLTHLDAEGSQPSISLDEPDLSMVKSTGRGMRFNSALNHTRLCVVALLA